MTEAKKSASKRLGHGFFIAAVIFLCNPCINIVDILPDFFGYCFLIWGLSKWADLCPNIAEAVRGLSRLRWFMLLKLLAVVLVPLVDDTYVLLFTFSFAVIEAIYVFPAIGHIFDGFEYFGTRYDGRAVFANIKNVRFLTYLTFIIKYAFVVLPELCELSSYEYSGWVTATPQVDIANYKGPITAIALFFSLLATVLWLINILPYIGRISKSREFLERVVKAYDEEIAADEGLAHRRNVRLVFTLIIAGIAFIPRLWIDGYNVIPSFVGGLFLVFATVIMCRKNGTAKYLVAVPTLYTAVSGASFAVSTLFAARYSLKDIEYEFEAYELYNTGIVLSVIEYVLLALCAIMIGREVLRIVKRHLAASDADRTARYSKISDVHLREDIRALIGALVLLLIVIVGNAVYMVLRTEIAEGFYIVALAASLIAVFRTASVLNTVYSQIEYKYM